MDQGSPIAASPAFLTPDNDGTDVLPPLQTPFPIQLPEVQGVWSEIITLPNVPIHTHVLPTGKVLFWGRRTEVGSQVFSTLNDHTTDSYLWDPADPQAAAVKTANSPTDPQNQPINLFCSGHAFLPDGKLLAAGGHLFDGQGHAFCCFYDSAADQWSPGPVMNLGRWYPTVLALPEGGVFVISGSFPTGPLQPPVNQNAVNNIPQILENGAWRETTDFDTLPLFPRLHVAPDGSIFMSGSNAPTYLLENYEQGQPGNWAVVGDRSAGNSDYAPAVSLDGGKVMFIGGGAPTSIVEMINLSAAQPAWAKIAQMNFPRRQHNATILPDGTVLVTGGTKGPPFNDLSPQGPVHQAELWDPSTGWHVVASEKVDRCYHSTSVLLPDGRVFSGGGGEFAPSNGVANAAADTHANAQLFSPPYLFKGPRPVITQAPPLIFYGGTFEVQTPTPADIGTVSWIRLPSVTHSMNQSQGINFLSFELSDGKLVVDAPPNANVCPPGHYMLFILSENKVPSVARIVQVAAFHIHPIPFTAAPMESTVLRRPTAPPPQLNPVEKAAAIRESEKKPPVVVGITATCPYGLSACSGGALQALEQLEGVRRIIPLANAEDSTLSAYLKHDGLPDIEVWPRQFAAIANGVHFYRGVEITADGAVNAAADGTLQMQASDGRPPLLLQPIESADKIQWDSKVSTPQPLAEEERMAFAVLRAAVLEAGGPVEVSVTGPLQKWEAGFVLKVRLYSFR